MGDESINWTLIQILAGKPHKHLNISGCELTCKDGHAHEPGTGEVLQEARTVQHLCDLAGVPEGRNYSAHIDARVFLLLAEVFQRRDQLDRITTWHSRETGPGGMVGDCCTECGNRWPCDTRRMADGTYTDETAAETVKLPCLCPAEQSMVTLADGRQMLITNPAVRDPVIYLNLPATVWCAGGHGWVPITDEQYKAFQEHVIVIRAADEMA